ncbi:MAG TPA: NAD(+)/NADH kinase [Clostridiaceae bacterium]|nr:NAD(+)/NADH kinase [Clostridiaceae bacterium]
MGTIGIIANPSSGKDIRRLVSHATTVDNNEKLNIVERIILAAQAYGVRDFLIMPDTFQTGYTAIDHLNNLGELTGKIEILDMTINGSVDDTILAAAEMEKRNIDCIVVLGGDGTSRAVAKSIKNTPIIPLSTGTNNVYPDLIEGTVAGMAAAMIASGRYDLSKITRRDKRIEIYKNEVLMDIALVDAVITSNPVQGSKAIWNTEEISKIIVSRAHPASIGFSSIAGCRKIVSVEDDFGMCVDLSEKKYKILAPIAAGTIKPVTMGDEVMINLNEDFRYETRVSGTIALDGEREIAFQAGNEFVFRITRNGPLRVDIRKTVELAHNSGFFNIGDQLNIKEKI